MDAIDVLSHIRRRYIKARRLDLLTKLRTTNEIERTRGRLDELDEIERKIEELFQKGEPTENEGSDDDGEDIDGTGHRPDGAVGNAKQTRRGRATDRG